MFKRIIIECYKLGSASAKNLSVALKEKGKKVLRIKRNSPTFKAKKGDYHLHWGSTKDVVVNKRSFFEFISGWNQGPNKQYEVNIPDWTTDKDVAKTWKSLVVCRKLLSSHSGNGIVLHENGGDNELPSAPLYVAYKKKTHEYRVHFFKNSNGTFEVIDVTQKKKRKDFEGEVNTKIRNHQNGWVYCREGIEESADLRTQALNAALACDIKLGAVDLIYNQKENKCYVLEINSAPGIEGTSVTNYVNAILKDMTNEV